MAPPKKAAAPLPPRANSGLSPGSSTVKVARERLMSGGSSLIFRRSSSWLEDVELVGVAEVERHRGGEELDRIVRLQPRRLVGDQRVGGGVALVEAVAGELVDQLEDLRRLGALHAARRWRRR